MTNKYTVKRNRRLRARAGRPSHLSQFARDMLAHIEQTRKELERVAYRGGRSRELQSTSEEAAK